MHHPNFSKEVHYWFWSCLPYTGKGSNHFSTRHSKKSLCICNINWINFHLLLVHCSRAAQPFLLVPSSWAREVKSQCKTSTLIQESWVTFPLTTFHLSDNEQKLFPREMAADIAKALGTLFNTSTMGVSCKQCFGPLREGARNGTLLCACHLIPRCFQLGVNRCPRRQPPVSSVALCNSYLWSCLCFL